MIGLVIVAHDGLADALSAGMQHVVGPQEGVVAIAIGPQDDLRQRQTEIESAVASVDTGEGVVLVTDMFGGTPSNLANGALAGPRVEVVYGANLPLLVKLAKMRDRPLHEAVDAAVQAGRKYINSAGAILEANSS